MMVRYLSFTFLVTFAFSSHGYANEGSGRPTVFVDKKFQETKVYQFLSKTSKNSVTQLDYERRRDKPKALVIPQKFINFTKIATKPAPFPEVEIKEESHTKIELKGASMPLPKVEIREVKEPFSLAYNPSPSFSSSQMKYEKYFKEFLPQMGESCRAYNNFGKTDEEILAILFPNVPKGEYPDLETATKKFAELAANNRPYAKLFNPPFFSFSGQKRYEDYFKKFLPQMGESCRAYNNFDKTDEEILAILFPNVPKGEYPDLETATKKFAELAANNRPYAKLFNPPFFSFSEQKRYEDYFKKFLPQMGESCRAYNNFDKTDEEILAILFPNVPKGEYPDLETATKKFAELAANNRPYAKLFNPPALEAPKAVTTLVHVPAAKGVAIPTPLPAPEKIAEPTASARPLASKLIAPTPSSASKAPETVVQLPCPAPKAPDKVVVQPSPFAPEAPKAVTTPAPVSVAKEEVTAPLSSPTPNETRDGVIPPPPPPVSLTQPVPLAPEVKSAAGEVLLHKPRNLLDEIQKGFTLKKAEASPDSVRKKKITPASSPMDVLADKLLSRRGAMEGNDDENGDDDDDDYWGSSRVETKKRPALIPSSLAAGKIVVKEVLPVRNAMDGQEKDKVAVIPPAPPPPSVTTEASTDVGIPTPPPPPPLAMNKDEKDKLDAATAAGIPPTPPPPPVVHKKTLPRSATLPNLRNPENPNEEGGDDILTSIRKGKTLKRANTLPDLRKPGKKDIVSETEKRIEEAKRQMELRRPVSSHDDEDDDADWD